MKYYPIYQLQLNHFHSDQSPDRGKTASNRWATMIDRQEAGVSCWLKTFFDVHVHMEDGEVTPSKWWFVEVFHYWAKTRLQLTGKISESTWGCVLDYSTHILEVLKLSDVFGRIIDQMADIRQNDNPRTCFCNYFMCFLGVSCAIWWNSLPANVVHDLQYTISRISNLDWIRNNWPSVACLQSVCQCVILLTSHYPQSSRLGGFVV